MPDLSKTYSSVVLGFFAKKKWKLAQARPHRFPFFFFQKSGNKCRTRYESKKLAMSVAKKLRMFINMTVVLIDLVLIIVVFSVGCEHVWMKKVDESLRKLEKIARSAKFLANYKSPNASTSVQEILLRPGSVSLSQVSTHTSIILPYQHYYPY